MNPYNFLIIAAAFSSATVPAFANVQVQNAKPQSLHFNEIAQRCGNGLHPNTLQAVARVESGFNPYAIGVVRGRLKRQPHTLAEAVSTAKMLHAQGKNFSMGLMQINRYNLKHYGLNYETVFDVCKNISTGAKILTQCYQRAGGKTHEHWQMAFSCYYSGNFKTGFRSDFKGQPPYVSKILRSASLNNPDARIHHSGKIQTVAYQPNSNMLASMPAVESVAKPKPEKDQETDNRQKVALTIPRQSAEWDIFEEF